MTTAPGPEHEPRLRLRPSTPSYTVPIWCWPFRQRLTLVRQLASLRRQFGLRRCQELSFVVVLRKETGNGAQGTPIRLFIDFGNNVPLNERDSLELDRVRGATIVNENRGQP